MTVKKKSKKSNALSLDIAAIVLWVLNIVLTRAVGLQGFLGLFISFIIFVLGAAAFLIASKELKTDKNNYDLKTARMIGGLIAVIKGVGFILLLF